MPINRLQLCLSLSLVSFPVLSICTLIWASGRGLGLGDEGVYVLSARYPEDIAENVSAVYEYTGFMFKAVGFDLVFFRLLGAALLLFSSLVFWIGLNKYISLRCRVSLPSLLKIACIGFFAAGTLLFYQWFFATPNNYLLTSVALNFLCGCLTFGLSKSQKNVPIDYRDLMAYCCSGLWIGVLTFVKVSSGVIIAFAVIVLILLHEKRSIRAKALALCALCIGFSLWLGIHFTVFTSPEDTLRGFRKGWTLFQAFGAHVPGVKIVAIPLETLWLFGSAFFVFWPSYVMLLAFLVVDKYILKNTPSRLTRDHRVYVSIFMLLIVLMLYPAWSIDARSEAVSTLPVYVTFQLGFTLLLIVVTTVFAINNPKRERLPSARKVITENFLLLTLLVMPLCAAVGTANPIYNVVAFYALPWFAVMVLCLTTTSFGSYFATRALPLLCMFFVTFFTTSQTIRGMIYNPQQVRTALTIQSIPTPISGGARTIKLDAESYRLVTSLSKILQDNGFQVGDDIVALSYIPGLVYMLGAKSPGHPTFLSRTPGERAYSRIAISFADLDRLRSSYVLLNAPVTDMSALLSTRGIAFPIDYQKLGAHQFLGNEFSLWKPN